MSGNLESITLSAPPLVSSPNSPLVPLSGSQ